MCVQSILALARSWGEFKVTEGNVKMSQFVRAIKEGRVRRLLGRFPFSLGGRPLWYP